MSIPTHIDVVDFGAIYNAHFNSGTDSTQAMRDACAYAATLTPSPSIIISGNVLTGDIPELVQHPLVVHIKGRWFLKETLHMEQGAIIGDRRERIAGFSREGTSWLAAHNTMPDGATTLVVSGHKTAEIRNINIRARAGIGIELYGVTKHIYGVVVGSERGSATYATPAIRLCNSYWSEIERCTFGVLPPSIKPYHPDYPSRAAVWIGTDANAPNTDHCSNITIRDSVIVGGSIVLDPRSGPKGMGAIAIENVTSELPVDPTHFLRVLDGNYVVGLTLTNCDLADNAGIGSLIHNEHSNLRTVDLDCKISLTTRLTGNPINGLFNKRLSSGIKEGLQASSTHDWAGIVGTTWTGKTESHWWQFGLCQPGPWLGRTNQQPTSATVEAPNFTPTAFQLQSGSSRPRIFDQQKALKPGDIVVGVSWVKRPQGKTRTDLLYLAIQGGTFRSKDGDRPYITSASSYLWSGGSLALDAEYWTVVHVVGIIASANTGSRLQFELVPNNLGDGNITFWMPTLYHIPAEAYSDLHDIYKRINYQLLPCDCSCLDDPQMANHVAEGGVVKRYPGTLLL